MAIEKAVIPVAGMGTRLLPAAKEQPKEMLPVFARAVDQRICLKPLLQLVFEQLFDSGFRELCFVVGRTKRAIEDYFTPDPVYISVLNNRGKAREASLLEDFYEKLDRSKVAWINQPEPRGFGEAVLRAEAFVRSDDFLVHAGDTYIISPGNNHLDRLRTAHSRLDADASLMVRKVKDPSRHGVIVSHKREDGVHEVRKAVEKPEKPISDMALMPIYIFKPDVIETLKTTSPGIGGELWLTDAIQGVIDRGGKVLAVELQENEVRLDVGTPESYWEALNLSYKRCTELPSGA